MPRITVLVGSPRVGGNTDTLADAYIEGAQGAGAEVSKISLASLSIAPCMDCGGCEKTKKCVIDDDMQSVYDQLAQTDVLAIATPVYFYSFSAQMKAVIDRLHNPLRKTFPIRAAVLLSVCADDESAFGPITDTYKAICAYEGWLDIGSVTVPKVEAKGDIGGNNGIDLARALGRLSARA